MTYRLRRFGSTELPLAEATFDAGTGPTNTGMARTAGGGFFDSLGTGQGDLELPYTIELDAELVEATVAALRTTTQGLKALRGQRLQLWREMSDNGYYQYAWARLLRVPAERDYTHRLWQPIRLQFEILTEWRAVFHGSGWLLDDGLFFDDGLYLDTGDTNFTLSAGSGNPNNVTLPNAGSGGTAVRAVLITLTCGATTNITAVTITNSTTLCKFTWTGTLATTTALIINTGAQTVTNNGADAFSGFVLDATNHKQSWWFELATGNNAVVVTLTGGAANSTILFEYAEGWE